jgi:hypothetical protein
MPVITVKVTADQKAGAEAEAAREGVTLSEHVRRALDFARDSDSLAERLDGHEQRLNRLEGVAGLD